MFFSLKERSKYVQTFYKLKFPNRVHGPTNDGVSDQLGILNNKKTSWFRVVLFIISKSEEYYKMSASLPPLLYAVSRHGAYAQGQIVYLNHKSPHRIGVACFIKHPTSKFIKLSRLRSIVRLHRPLALPKMSSLIASIFLCLI